MKPRGVHGYIRHIVGYKEQQTANRHGVNPVLKPNPQILYPVDVAPHQGQRTEHQHRNHIRFYRCEYSLGIVYSCSRLFVAGSTITATLSVILRASMAEDSTPTAMPGQYCVESGFRCCLFHLQIGHGRGSMRYVPHADASDHTPWSGADSPNVCTPAS